MKIAWFKKVISPEIGAYMAGYGLDDKSVAKLDDLYMTGLCADDGERKVLLVSFDLLGLDEWYIKELRQTCAKILGIDECAVLLSCTHTENTLCVDDPHTAKLDKVPYVFGRRADQRFGRNTAYLDRLKVWLAEEVKHLDNYRECSVYFYSSKCDENRNRRYISACNHSSYIPFRRELAPLAGEYADKELGELCFIDKETGLPAYVIGN